MMSKSQGFGIVGQKCLLTVGPMEYASDEDSCQFFKDEWVCVDAGLPICHSSSDKEIVEEVQEEMGLLNGKDEEEEDIEDAEPELPPSVPEAT